jgi:hypothetical protein
MTTSQQWQHDYLVNGDIDDQTHSNGYELPRAARARFWFSLDMAYAYKAYTLDRLHNFPKSQYIRMTNYFRSSGPSTRPLASSASFLHLLLSFKCLRPSSEVLDPSHNVLVDMVEGLLKHCATCTSTISDGRDLDGCPTMSCSEFLLGRDLNDYCGGRYGTPLIAAIALSAAVMKDNGPEHSLVQLLLDRGADIDMRGNAHDSALDTAAYRDAAYQVSLDVRVPRSIVKLLLDRGADVNLEDPEGCNIALKEEGSRYGGVRTVEMLIRAGAYAKVGSRAAWISRPAAFIEGFTGVYTDAH